MVVLSNTTIYYLHHEIDLFLLYPIAIIYSTCIPILLINAVSLFYSSRYWNKARNTAGNDSTFKTATVNYVNLGLSSLMLFLELVLVLTRALYKALVFFPCHHLELLDQQECKVARQILEPFYNVGTLLLISIGIMLCLFMNEVITNSKIDFEILHQQARRTFWLCVFTFALCAVGNELIGHIGVVVTDIIQIYLCWIFYKRMRNLYMNLKSKCLDYIYEPKKYRYFRSQAVSFKWCSLLAMPAIEIFIISTAILQIYTSVYFLIYQKNIHHVIHTNNWSLWMAGLLTLGTIERISFLHWTLVTTLANYYLLFISVRKALKYRKLISKPIHYKLVQIEFGSYKYRRVSY